MGRRVAIYEHWRKKMIHSFLIIYFARLICEKIFEIFVIPFVNKFFAQITGKHASRLSKNIESDKYNIWLQLI